MGIMDWLRRNWPDLLIGVALVAVIAGIIATLISGGTFFPVGGGNRTADTPSQSGSAVAGSNQTAPPVGGQSPSAAVPAPPDGAGAPVGAGATDAATTDDAGAPDGGGAPDGAVAPTVTLTDTPTTQSDTTSSPPVATDPTQGGGVSALPPDGGQSTSSLTTTAPSSSAAATSTPSTPSSSAVTAATSVAASSVPDAPYRVSVGAYGNIDNAQRQLEAFRAAGYPVFLGTQGNLNIVLVGPYDTETEARGVAQRIRESNLGVPDPTVYLLEDDDEAPSASPASTATVATPASQTPAVQTEPTQQPTSQSTTATSSGDRYLQVGAYGSRESSLPQRERLESLGFVVSERLESDLVKLVIGPFDSSGLANAQSRLQAAGIDSFPR